MSDADAPIDPPLSRLDHATPPQQPPPPDRTLERFTAGAGLVFLAILGVDAWEDGDMICCASMGLLVEIAMVAGLFALGRLACRWWRGGPIVERNGIATFVGGTAAVLLPLGAVTLAERFGGIPGNAGRGAALAAFAFPTAVSPFLVYGKGPIR